MRFADAARFLRRAQPWLMRSEPEHNLILGITNQLLSPGHPYQDPIYLATVEDEGEIVGCVFRTPPYKLGLTRMPPETVAPLVEDLSQVYQELPAVLGPEREAIAFAEAWTALHGGSHRIVMHNRIFALEEVIMPQRPASGSFVPATPADLPLVETWMHRFHVDTGLSQSGSGRLARSAIESGGLALWLDPGPVSMAGATGPTPNGIRVGFVYTPPELRGRGYATSCVAELSRRQLDSGKEFCFLYTDLANPTSNRIYEGLGYRAVCDVVDVVIE